MKCRACGFENIAGVDRCENCMEPFRDIDVPHPTEGLQAHIMMDAVSQVYSPNPAAVSMQDSALKAVEVMRERKAGCVLVLDGDNVAGILTEADLLFKPADDLSTVNAATLMTPKPETVEENASMAYALQRMSIGGYRHIPVVRNGKAVGIISIKDLLNYLHERLF